MQLNTVCIFAREKKLAIILFVFIAKNIEIKSFAIPNPLYVSDFCQVHLIMCIVNCAIPQFHMHGQDRFHFIDPAALCFNGQSVALNQNVFKNQTLVSSFRKCNITAELMCPPPAQNSHHHSANLTIILLLYSFNLRFELS